MWRNVGCLTLQFTRSTRLRSEPHATALHASIVGTATVIIFMVVMLIFIR